MANIVLAGFDSETAKKLSQKLIDLHHQTESLASVAVFAGAKQADLLFLSGDDVRYPRGLTSLIKTARSTPVIVASRTGEDSAWLTALEAGAADYCPLDVDPANLQWMIENALHDRPQKLKAFAAVSAA